MCDDENIEPISEDDLANYFGDNITGAGYVLFYQAVDLDLRSLGLKKVPQPKVRPSVPVHLVEEAKKVLEPRVVEVPVSPVAPVSPALSTPAKVPVAPAVPVTPVAAPVDHARTSSPSTPSLPSSSGTPNGSMRREATTTSTLLTSAFMEHNSPARRDASIPRREPSMSGRSPGDKANRWSILKRKDDGRSPLQRQGTSTTLGTVNTDSTSSMHQEPAAEPAPHQPTDLSSSVMSSLSATSGGAASSGRSSPPPPPPPVAMSNLGRSASAARADRTPSGMSTSNGYAGGGSLGRKLSDRTGLGKLARTTSSGWKMGFGKKGKVDE